MTDKGRTRNSKKKISSRFRKINIALFMCSSVAIAVVMVMVLRNITDTVSKDYARLYSTNTSGALSTHLLREIALVQKAARSRAVVEWFSDEYNYRKKSSAHAEMLEVIDVLYSDNLYLGISGSLNEYAVEDSFSASDIKPHAILDPDYYDDAWFFECAVSDNDYVLNVDIDKLLQRKRVWINHKVTLDGVTLGVICSGLEFAQTAQELLSEYDNTKVRGLIIDENGVVQMDSISMGDDNFLRYESFYQIEDEFNDPMFLQALREHLGSVDGFFKSNAPIVIDLSEKPYSYATITPIVATKWSVVTFYNSSSLFNLEKLLPLFIIMPSMFICFIILNGAMSYRILFKPVELLIHSLSQIGGRQEVEIYGLDRDDEIGNLSKAIRDMLDNAHIDKLTGIHNRRYLDENIERIIYSLSRSGGIISVLMIDIDYFKQYNDTYGHVKGDECLKTVAAALSGSLMRSDDFVARYGGEEFVAVLPNTDASGAKIIANRMMKNVQECNMEHEASEAGGRVTVSVGVVTAKAHYGQSGEDYMRQADEALYMSKRNGRNRITSVTL